MVLQVSTTDILVIRKFGKNRDKTPVFAWEREVSFVFSYWGFREFEGLINFFLLKISNQLWKIVVIQGRVISKVNEHQSLHSITPILNESQVVFSLTSHAGVFSGARISLAGERQTYFRSSLLSLLRGRLCFHYGRFAAELNFFSRCLLTYRRLLAVSKCISKKAIIVVSMEGSTGRAKAMKFVNRNNGFYSILIDSN